MRRGPRCRRGEAALGRRPQRVSLAAGARVRKRAPVPAHPPPSGRAFPAGGPGGRLVRSPGARPHPVRPRRPGERFTFPALRALLARANEPKAGDVLAGLAARSERERVAAKPALADVTLGEIADAPPVDDEVTRLIHDTHDRTGFASLRSLTVGGFRELLLDHGTDGAALARLHRAVTPEVAAAAAKLMGNKELVYVAAKVRVVTRWRYCWSGAARADHGRQPVGVPGLPPAAGAHRRRPEPGLERPRARGAAGGRGPAGCGPGGRGDAGGGERGGGQGRPSRRRAGVGQYWHAPAPDLTSAAGGSPRPCGTPRDRPHVGWTPSLPEPLMGSRRAPAGRPFRRPTRIPLLTLRRSGSPAPCSSSRPP